MSGDQFLSSTQDEVILRHASPTTTIRPSNEEQCLARPKSSHLVFQSNSSLSKRIPLSQRRNRDFSLSLVTKNNYGGSDSAVATPQSPITPLIKSHPSLVISSQATTCDSPSYHAFASNKNSNGVDPTTRPILNHVRDYIITGDITVPSPSMLPVINVKNGRLLRCKVIAKKDFLTRLRASYLLTACDHIMQPLDVLRDETPNTVLLMFPPACSDLQTFMQAKKGESMREGDAKILFRQIATALADCHDNNVVVRDLKMKKIVVTDVERLEVKLDFLDSANVLENDSEDSISERSGCPAYVSPEMLKPPPLIYSAKRADAWSLGVVLYGLLVGRYPFYDKDPIRMLAKIYRGKYYMPQKLSGLAKSLLVGLLTSDPKKRMTADDVLRHPWFRIKTDDCNCNSTGTSSSSSSAEHEVMVVSHSTRRHHPYQRKQTAPSALAHSDDQLVPSL